MTKFHFKINDGEEQTIEIASSYYLAAAAAAISVVDNDQIDKGIKIEVWIPELLPDYKGHVYAVVRNEFGNLEIGVARGNKPIRIPLP